MKAAAFSTWANRSRAAHLLAAAVFALILTIQFAPVLVGAKVFTDTATQQGYVFPWAAEGALYPFALQSDQSDLSMPALRVQQRAYEAGELPHVDLYSYGGGYPLYADFSTGQGYPPRMVLAALFSPVDAHFLFTALHLFGAGMFTYLLLRRLRSRWLSAVFAGSAWMVGGWTMAWMHLAPIVVLSALFPASLWAMHRAVGRRTWEATITSSVLLGTLVIAGHALFGLVAAGVTGIYGLCSAAHRWREDRPTAPRARWWLATVVPATAIVAIGMWAVVLVPLAAASADSARGAFTWAEMRAGQLASPDALWDVVRPPTTPLDLEHFNTLAFVGIPTALLAMVGLFCRRPGSGLGRGLVVGATLAMLPGPVSWLLFHAVPLFDVFRPYARLAFFLGFGVVVLAAVGLDRLADAAGQRWPADGAPRVRTALLVAAMVMVVANVAHLTAFGAANNPALAPREEASVLPDTPFTAALRTAAAGSDNGWPGRAMVLSPVEAPGAPTSAPILWGAGGAWVGVEVSSGYNSSMPQRTQRLLRALAGERIDTILERDWTASFLPEVWWGSARYPLLPRAGYDLVVTPPVLNASSAWGAQHVRSGELEVVYEGVDGNVFRIIGAEAGARGVTQVEVVDDDTAALRRFTDETFDSSTTVLLSPTDAAALDLPAGGPAMATVTDAERGPNGYHFTVDAPERTLVVVPVNWGEGWSASAEGQGLTLLRGNYGQVVLVVPEGTSQVSLQYRSPGFTPGLLLTVCTVVLLLAVPLIRRVHRARAG